MRDMIVVLTKDVARDACLHCGGDLRVSAGSGARDVIEFCPSCQVEHRIDVSADGARVKVRLPFNADRWFRVRSSNLHSAGCRGADLIVRFNNGAAYLYPGAGPLLPELLEAESKGRFFQARIRPLTCRRLV
jgi:hypothetical protein